MSPEDPPPSIRALAARAQHWASIGDNARALEAYQRIAQSGFSDPALAREIQRLRVATAFAREDVAPPPVTGIDGRTRSGFAAVPQPVQPRVDATTRSLTPEELTPPRPAPAAPLPALPTAARAAPVAAAPVETPTAAPALAAPPASPARQPGQLSRAVENRLGQLRQDQAPAYAPDVTGDLNARELARLQRGMDVGEVWGSAARPAEGWKRGGRVDPGHRMNMSGRTRKGW